MAFEGGQKRKKLVWSMAILAATVVGAGLLTMAVTNYFRSQNPIYQCMHDPAQQPFQLSVPINVTEDGRPVPVPKGIGIDNNCIHPIYTLDQNIIHVSYSRPYDFTLGHFLYYWLGDKLQNFNTKVFINGRQHTEGSILDIPLKGGESIHLILTRKS